MKTHCNFSISIPGHPELDSRDLTDDQVVKQLNGFDIKRTKRQIQAIEVKETIITENATIIIERQPDSYEITYEEKNVPC